MPTPQPVSVKAICDEILAQAHRQEHDILQRAQDQAEEILAKATAASEQARQQYIDSARKDAARQAESILATVRTETSRLRSAKTDELVQSIYTEARASLQACQSFNYKQAVVRLAAEAINQMEGNAFVIKIAKTNCLEPGIEDEMVNQVKRPVQLRFEKPGPEMTAGVIIESDDGRQIWDNQLAARLARAWGDLRFPVAKSLGLIPSTNS